MLIFCIFSIVSLIFAQETVATNYFFDDFISNSLDEKWEFVNGSGSCSDTFKTDGGQLIGEVTTGCSSFLYSKNTQNLFDYEIDLKSKNISGVDQDLLFRVSPNKNNYYLLGFRYKDPYWSQDNNNVVLYRVNDGRQYLIKEVRPIDFADSFELSQDKFHNIKLSVFGKNIKVYFDSILIINVNDNKAILDGGIGFLNWGGNYFQRSSKNIYDYVKISDGNEQIRKIVIIPGLGASWNSNAMVYNETINDNEWGMTPFVKNYDGLINGLESNSLVKNQDFFVWNYDWRKPVSEIVNSLNNFINLKIGESEKVDLVGHSLGGLTARIWAKDNINNPKLGKIITAGAPDKGAIDAYEVWNGGQISNNGSVSSIGLNILLQLQKMRYKSNLEAVRNFAPVVKDLLPAFDFIKKNNLIISLNKLSVRNNYLTDINTFNFSLLPEYKAFMGIGKNTEEWINVQDRNIFDNVLGIWPDGRPIRYSYGSGDGTVLRKSTIGLNVEEINSNHGNIVNKSTENILSELGIGGTFLDSDLDDGLENGLIFFVGSPVNMKVKCDNGNEISDVDGFVMIKNEGYKNCQVILIGIDDGKYHLVTGSTDNSDSWQYYENDISNGQVKNILIDVNDGKLTSNTDNIDFLYELILKDTNNLKTQYLNNNYLKNITIAVENKNLDAITKNIFDFRKNTKEMKISKNIIKNIETLLSFSHSSATKSKSWSEYLKAVQKKSLVDSVARLKNRAGVSPSLFSSESYELMTGLIETAEKNYKEGKYADSVAKSIVALKYGMEI